MGRAHEFVRALRDCPSLAVVCHDDPDPDSLASALAVAWLAERCAVPNVRILYGGSISHQQNRAMVRHFRTDVLPLASAAPAETDLVIFVDHALPGEHTELPPETAIDVVIDHHEYTEPVHAGFVDLRPEYGATTTILVEYLSDLDYRPPTELASLLLFALHRERLDHVRNPTPHEYEAAVFLSGSVDRSIIKDLYGAQFSPSTLDTIGSAIRNRQIHGSCLVSWVGSVTERDALPQAANYLLTLRNVDTVLVFGLLDDELHLSARSADPGLRLDRVIRRVVGPDGPAGGHEDMAGGVIPVDPHLVDDLDEATFDREVVSPVTERFLDAVGAQRSSGT